MHIHAHASVFTSIAKQSNGMQNKQFGGGGGAEEDPILGAIERPANRLSRYVHILNSPTLLKLACRYTLKAMHCYACNA